jgi:hypothetical protein
MRILKKVILTPDYLEDRKDPMERDQPPGESGHHQHPELQTVLGV